MPIDARLENYLATLDRILRPIPTSERADIVMEIKSHVLSGLERDPQASTESLLRALGEPETVANRYLLERGLKPSKPPISPVVKWLVLGGLGCGAMLFLGLGVLAYSFAPLLKVNESEGKVVLLGGLIDIDESKGRVKVGDAEFFSFDEKQKFRGEAKILPKGKISVLLSNGHLTFGTADDQRFSWDCHGSSQDPEPSVNTAGGTSTLDMSKLRGAKCEIKIPKDSPLAATVNNGKLRFEKPLYDIDATLDNGRLSVQPDPGATYAYEFKIDNGRTDHPPSATNPQYRVKAKVANGHLSVE